MKDKKFKVTCPVCNQQVGRKKLKKIKALFPFSGAILAEGSDFLLNFMHLVSKFPNFYQWACDHCIGTKKAILANPKKQFYTFKHPQDTATPYLVYVDKTFTCQNCKEDFLFSKKEQQYWYEELSFVVYAKPINCKACRKKIRGEKALNTDLSKLLEEGMPKDKAKLLKIVEIYEKMGNFEKMKKYYKEFRKL